MADAIDENLKIHRIVKDEQIGGRGRNEEEEVKEIVVQSIPSNDLNTRILKSESSSLDGSNALQLTDLSYEGHDKISGIPNEIHTKLPDGMIMEGEEPKEDIIINDTASDDLENSALPHSEEKPPVTKVWTFFEEEDKSAVSGNIIVYYNRSEDKDKKEQLKYIGQYKFGKKHGKGVLLDRNHRYLIGYRAAPNQLPNYVMDIVMKNKVENLSNDSLALDCWFDDTLHGLAPILIGQYLFEVEFYYGEPLTLRYVDPDGKYTISGKVEMKEEDFKEKDIEEKDIIEEDGVNLGLMKVRFTGDVEIVYEEKALRYIGQSKKFKPNGKGKVFTKNGEMIADGSFVTGYVTEVVFPKVQKGDNRWYEFKGVLSKNGIDWTSLPAREINGIGKWRCITDNQMTGEYYEGNIQNNQRSEQGTLFKWSGGSWREVYRGKWAKDMYDGKGKLTEDDGTIYEGTFKSGAFTKGIKRCNNEEYEGDFKNGNPINKYKKRVTTSVVINNIERQYMIWSEHDPESKRENFLQLDRVMEYGKRKRVLSYYKSILIWEIEQEDIQRQRQRQGQEDVKQVFMKAYDCSPEKANSFMTDITSFFDGVKELKERNVLCRGLEITLSESEEKWKVEKKRYREREASSDMNKKGKEAESLDLTAMILEVNHLSNLTEITIVSYNFPYIRHMILNDLEKLNILNIKKECFTEPDKKSDYGIFQIDNCPKLREISIGDSCFKYFRSFSLSKLPGLEKLMIGEWCFRNSDLKLIGLDQLKMVSLGGHAFENCSYAEFSNLQQLQTIQFIEGDYTLRGRPWDKSPSPSPSNTLVMQNLPALTSIQCDGECRSIFQNMKIVTIKQCPELTEDRLEKAHFGIFSFWLTASLHTDNPAFEDLIKQRSKFLNHSINRSQH